MAAENFCLKWNDHHSVFFSNAEKLCHGSLLTDVVISASGTLFQAHKLVLSVCSTFFQVIFCHHSLLSIPPSLLFLGCFFPSTSSTIAKYCCLPQSKYSVYQTSYRKICVGYSPSHIIRPIFSLQNCYLAIHPTTIVQLFYL